MKRFIKTWGLLIIVTVVNFVGVYLNYDRFTAVPLTVLSYGSAVIAEESPAWYITPKQFAYICEVNKLEYELDVETKSLRVSMVQREVVEDVPLKTVRSDERRIYENDIKAQWLTREDDYIVTYQFMETPEFGPYTVFKVLTEDSSREIFEIYAGFYSIDDNNALHLDFNRRLVEKQDVLEAVEKSEVWTLTADDVFVHMSKGAQKISMTHQELADPTHNDEESPVDTEEVTEEILEEPTTEEEPAGE